MSLIGDFTDEVVHGLGMKIAAGLAAKGLIDPKNEELVVDASVVEIQLALVIKLMQAGQKPA